MQPIFLKILTTRNRLQKGPASSICALQTSPDDGSDLIAWQCIGNQTQGVYEVTTGKWFNTINGGTNANLPVDDASNNPDTSAILRWDAQQNSLVETSNQTGFSSYDQACTAVNETTFSTALYRANDEIARNATPVDAAPCYRAGAMPIQIQDLTSWESQGCSEGFLCLSPL
jgi:hypothetical protein